MTGLTDAGFVAARLPEIKTDIEGRLVEAFGQPDLRAESIFGQLVGISAEMDAVLWMLAQDIYASQYPDMATGVNLDHVVSLNGVIRAPSRPTQVEAVCFGSIGTELLAGREARNPSTNDLYRTRKTVSISATQARSALVTLTGTGAGAYTVNVGASPFTYTSPGGETAGQILTALSGAIAGSAFSTALSVDSLLVTATSDQDFTASGGAVITKAGVAVDFFGVPDGAAVLPVGALSKIETAVAGWDSISNPQAGLTGADRETDEALRTRRARSIGITATNTLDALVSRLGQVDLVSEAAVFENSTDATDADGTPAHSMWAIVEGGDDGEIAEVIYQTRAGGIGMRGAVSVDVPSPLTGNETTIRFDRPTYVDPVLAVGYTRLSNFPVDGEAKILAALEAQQYAIGQPIIISQLYGAITCAVIGVQIDSLTLDAGTANIPAAKDERLRLMAANITLTDNT